MAARLVRVTWEFTIDDGDTHAETMKQIEGVTQRIDAGIATAPGTRVTRFEFRMPRVRLPRKTEGK